tara:strand:+ start:264 stop:893 length:630 start_codon:yes stop_codon:yes gene_type:complete
MATTTDRFGRTTGAAESNQGTSFGQASGSGKSKTKPKKTAAKSLNKSNWKLNTKVSQRTIDNIKSMGMTKALKQVTSTSKSKEFKEGVARLYGANRVAAAKKTVSAVVKKSPSNSVTKMSPRAAERAKPTKMSPRAAERVKPAAKSSTARSPRAAENAAKKKTTTARSPRAAENAAKKKTTTARSPRAAERAAANGRSSGRGGISQSQR